MSDKDWDNDGTPNDLDLTPGTPPTEEKPLEMPETKNEPQQEKKGGYSLTDDYPAQEDESGAARIPPNVNTAPVKIKTPSTYMGGALVAGSQVTVPFYEAQSLSNRYRGIGGKTYEDFVNKLRAYTNSELGTAAGVDAAWDMVLKDAYSSNMNAMDLLDRGPAVPGADEDSATGYTYGYGGYTGPRATVSMVNERDLRLTADAIGSEVLGRGITDKEFQKVLKQVRQAERAEPTVTSGGDAMTVSKTGISSEGRQNIIREALMQGPEAEGFGKATKMMDLFYSALEARPSGA